MKLLFDLCSLPTSLWIIVGCAPWIYCRDGNINHLSREGKPSACSKYFSFLLLFSNFSLCPKVLDEKIAPPQKLCFDSKWFHHYSPYSEIETILLKFTAAALNVTNVQINAAAGVDTAKRVGFLCWIQNTDVTLFLWRFFFSRFHFATDVSLFKDEPNPKCFTRTQNDFTCFFQTPDNKTYDFFYTVERQVVHKKLSGLSG